MSMQLNASIYKNMLEISNIFNDDEGNSPPNESVSLVEQNFSDDSKLSVESDLKTQCIYKSKAKVKANNLEMEVKVNPPEINTDSKTEEYHESKTIVKQERKRADSIEEVLPEDPFGDVIQADVVIEPKIEPEDIKVEPTDYDAGEDYGMDDNPEYNVCKVEEQKLQRSGICDFNKRQLRSAHTSKPEHYCKICLKQYQTTVLFRDHMITEHTSTETEYEHECKVCKAVYKTKSGLLKHISNKHSDKVKNKEISKYDCTECSMTYRSKTGLKLHMTRKHCRKEKDKEFRICSICSMTLIGKSRLNYHLVRQHNIKVEEFTSKCSYCSLTFDCENSVRTHVKRHHDDIVNKYKCKFCLKCYLNFNSYLRHQCGEEKKARTIKKLSQKVSSQNKNNNVEPLQSRDRMFQCSECKAVYRFKTLLTKHMAISHKIAGLSELVDCEVCGKTLLNSKNLKRHMLNQHSNKSFNCIKCDNTYKCLSALRRHVKRIHMQKCNSSLVMETDDTAVRSEVKLENEVLKCTECDLTFHSKKETTSAWTRLQKHIKTHSHAIRDVKIEQLEVVCQHCGKVCDDNNFQRHMRAEHKELLTLHRCTKCKYRTYDKLLLAKHDKWHLKGTQVIKCQFEGCTYTNFIKYNVEKHMSRHQMEKKKCELCLFETKDSFFMKNHMRAHETGKKVYQCENCSYETNNASGILQHKRKHGSGNRFKCNLCEFTTRFHSALWIHKNKKHTEASVRKLLKCKQCPYVTDCHGNMVQHRFVHGEAKFQCELCPFRTKFPSSLISHKKKHKNKITYIFLAKSINRK